MIDDKQLLYLQERIEKCIGLMGSEGRVINNGDGETYGVEFEGYQTVKFEIKPIFDMPDEEVYALLELFAHGLPLLAELILEIENLKSMTDALIDSIATVALIASGRKKRTNITEEEDFEKYFEDSDSQLTIGEK